MSNSKISWWLQVALALGALAAAGCNHTPVENLEKSFTLKVQTGTGDGDPIKVDFLWVIDNSTSMCQEQVSLARSFGTFTNTLREAFDIDSRVAVTSVDVQCQPSASVNSAKGTFNRRTTMVFPAPCQESRYTPCGSDAECAGADCTLLGQCGGEPGEWICRAPTLPECIENPNGSINSTCRRRCTTDTECQTVFGDANYVCQKPSSNQRDWGCMLPPATNGCPGDIGDLGYLTNDNLDLFRCVATVGVNQERCLTYEQPLMAGLIALDPTGPNADQAKGFLRDDAYLVVVFVSDEEDCSVPYDYSKNEEDSRFKLNETQYNTCGLLKTTDEGGQLVPVAHFVNKFKALKKDPGRVIVAAIAGDSLETTPEAITLDRQSFLESKGNPRTCHQQTTICNSINGVADYGSRFLALTQAFGPNGSFANICDDEGIGPALEQVARTIVAVINKVCLPRPVLDGLIVRRIRGGVPTELFEGDGPGSYRRVFGAEDCARDGQIMPAITFFDPPIPGEEIEIEYQGDPQFD